MTPLELPAPLPPRPERGHKGTSGRVAVVAGSADMPGAALLAVRAAYRAGAGIVRAYDLFGGLRDLLPLACPEAVLQSFEAETLEGEFEQRLRGLDEHALVFGPGLGDPVRTRRLADLAIAIGPTVTVFDADGLAAFAGEPEAYAALREERAILTPHPGEAARLLGREDSRALGADPVARDEAAAELAERSGAIVVLKGAGTIVRQGERQWHCSSGGPELSSAGTGDVLAGTIGAFASWCSSLASAGWTPFEAACAAVQAHARAGELAARGRRRGILASDLIEALPDAVAELELKGAGA